MYLFLQATTPARLCDDSSASLNAGTTMAPLGASMEATSKRLITSPATQRHLDITSHSVVDSLPARASPLPLKRARTTFPRMTPLLANMPPATKHLLTRILAPEIHTIAAFLFLFRLPALAPIRSPDSARRARPVVANLRAPVCPAIQKLGADIVAREVLEAAPPNILDGSAEAARLHQLRARRTRTGMAEEQAAVAAAVLQWPIADLAAGMGKNPGVVAGRILQFPAEAEVGFRDLGFRVVGPALGAVPERNFGGSGGVDGEARGGA
ncbi:hypothetical protein TIFTF001_010520 [Ficus carica]|uniref:Uncharacterized protein n=1 Tax=Ficus carica TaxID=3494 RepID=A0AA88ACD2_FICCA|nr:hypothetical protein TIFTF001_010520 [Ficus carica]